MRVASRTQHGVLIASASGTALQSSAPAPGLVTLLKNFPYAADVNQPFRTDWVTCDPQHENATIHVHCQTLSPALLAFGLGVKIHSSFDTVEAYQVGSNISVTAVGSYSTAITADLGPWLRVELINGEVVPLYAVLSVWIQPKNT